MKIIDYNIIEDLRRYKLGHYHPGEIIDEGEKLIIKAKKYLKECKQVPNLEKVNTFLLDIRKKYWTLE